MTDELVCPPTVCPSVKTPEQEIVEWEKRLLDEGLGMEAGRLTRVTYGARYHDTSAVHDYQQKPDNYNVSPIKRGRDNALRVLALIEQGMTYRAAAAKLGMDWRRAHRSVQRYKKNFCPPTQCSSEGSNVD